MAHNSDRPTGVDDTLGEEHVSDGRGADSRVDARAGIRRLSGAVLAFRGMADVAGGGNDRAATDPRPVASTDREPNRWAFLDLLGVAQLMVVLDATIVTIALPSAQKALGFSTESRQWHRHRLRAGVRKPSAVGGQAR